MSVESQRQGVETAEPAAFKDESVNAAESIIGGFDWEPLEIFDRGGASSPKPKRVAGRREMDMGPVTSQWPEDGIVHLDSGPLCAFGQHKYEAVAAPILLGSFWAGVVLAWWLTSVLIAERGVGVAGSLLAWAVFAAAVFAYRWLLLMVTELAFSFTETMLAAKGREQQEEDDYE